MAPAVSGVLSLNLILASKGNHNLYIRSKSTAHILKWSILEASETETRKAERLFRSLP